MLDDRRDAGERLAKELKCFKDRKEAIVLAIPRGGAEVGFWIAKSLNIDFALLVSRKLPFPHNKEAGFGAITEDGTYIVFKIAFDYLSQVEIEKIIEEQKEEVKRRIAILRDNQPLPSLTGKIVILVDDGLAMGATMQVSLAYCKKQSIQKLIVAVPVAAKKIAEKIGKEVDELIVLEIPEHFHSVAQVYWVWYDVADDEVLDLLDLLKKVRC
jgi:predicted phosphoribosyltransferase